MSHSKTFSPLDAVMFSGNINTFAHIFAPSRSSFSAVAALGGLTKSEWNPRFWCACDMRNTGRPINVVVYCLSLSCLHYVRGVFLLLSRFTSFLLFISLLNTIGFVCTPLLHISWLILLSHSYGLCSPDTIRTDINVRYSTMTVAMLQFIQPSSSFVRSFILHHIRIWLYFVQFASTGF